MKTKSFEEYVKETNYIFQNNNIFLCHFCIFVFLFLLLFKHLNELHIFLEQFSRTVNLDSNLIPCQCKLDVMAMFTVIKSLNPRIKQDQIAKELGCLIGTLL